MGKGRGTVRDTGRDRESLKLNKEWQLYATYDPVVKAQIRTRSLIIVKSKGDKATAPAQTQVVSKINVEWQHIMPMIKKSNNLFVKP